MSLFKEIIRSLILYRKADDDRARRCVKLYKILRGPQVVLFD